MFFSADWDKRFLRLARFWAQEVSKDPSSKVCAVIVQPNGEIAGIGYNGFPRGVRDLPERYNDRPTKYLFVQHSEPNAIKSAAGKDLKGATIYTWPFFTCNECAKDIIQWGITRVVCPEQEVERWQSAWDVAKTMYDEAGVRYYFVEDIDK